MDKDKDKRGLLSAPSSSASSSSLRMLYAQAMEPQPQTMQGQTHRAAYWAATDSEYNNNYVYGHGCSSSSSASSASSSSSSGVNSNSWLRFALGQTPDNDKDEKNHSQHQQQSQNQNQNQMTLSSLFTAVRMYAGIPSKVRGGMGMGVSLFIGRRVRSATLTLTVAVAAVALLLVLRVATLAPVCHHSSPACLIIPDDSPPATQPLVPLPLHPTVLYYNTHGGCAQNMKGVMRSLGVRVDHFNPQQVSGYGMNARRAKALIDQGHVDYVCSKYDIIILGDTIPHGRAILESLLLPNSRNQCRSKIVVEMTNRFDWDITDKSAYYDSISKLVQLSKTVFKDKLFWVANNNVEKAFLEHKVGVSMPHVRVLRPL
ncbi:hypothetical protein HK100_006328, partial [Physocladia obscura]